MIYNIILRTKFISTLLSENYLPIRPKTLWQPQKLSFKVNSRQNQQVITKWTPAKFDKRCQEINKKEIQNNNGQTKL